MYPLVKNHFDETSIHESQWKVCQCGKFKSNIKPLQWKYRVGLDSIAKRSHRKRTNGYYMDLNININNQIYETQLLLMGSNEIQRWVAPKSRKHMVGTATFGENMFIQQFGNENGTKGTDAGPYYVKWKLKEKYAKDQSISIKHVRDKEIRNIWLYNWSVHGLRQEKQNKLNTNQFVAMHNNKYIQGASQELFEKRIVLYVYAGIGAPNIEIMEINGHPLKSKSQWDKIKQKNQINQSKNGIMWNKTMQCDDTMDQKEQIDLTIVNSAVKSQCSVLNGIKQHGWYRDREEYELNRCIENRLSKQGENSMSSIISESDQQVNRHKEMLKYIKTLEQNHRIMQKRVEVLTSEIKEHKNAITNTKTVRHIETIPHHNNGTEQIKNSTDNQKSKSRLSELLMSIGFIDGNHQDQSSTYQPVNNATEVNKDRNSASSMPQPPLKRQRLNNPGIEG